MLAKQVQEAAATDVSVPRQWRIRSVHNPSKATVRSHTAGTSSLIGALNPPIDWFKKLRWDEVSRSSIREITAARGT